MTKQTGRNPPLNVPLCLSHTCKMCVSVIQ
nr:MAG TPA: hypothetical protein [Bacteriophage sp.]